MKTWSETNCIKLTLENAHIFEADDVVWKALIFRLAFGSSNVYNNVLQEYDKLNQFKLCYYICCDIWYELQNNVAEPAVP